MISASENVSITGEYGLVNSHSFQV